MRRYIKTICLVIIIGALFFVYWNSYSKNKGTRIVEWDNYYEENNIQLFYEPIKDAVEINKKLSKIESTYKVKEMTEKENEDLEKVLKVCDILNTIVKLDDVGDTKYVNAYDILMSKGENKKLSQKDMAIVARDLILTLGYEARIGIFRKEEPQFKNNSNYYVVEYWSPKYNEWVMVDFKEKGILERNGVPISSIELLSTPLKDLEYVGNNSENNLKRNIKPFLSSYSIQIDNTLSMKKSNSYITYVTSDKDLDLLSDGKFLPPTIYTKEKILFELSPWQKNEKNDKKAYLILMKKPPIAKPEESKSDQEKEEDNYKFTVGSFKNGSIIKNYYISLNGSDYEKIDEYKDIILIKGKNTINLSLDGKSNMSTIEIIRDK